jgi:hypothetical protein
VSPGATTAAPSRTVWCVLNASPDKDFRTVADTLKASLLDSDRREGVVTDLVNFVDQEVAAKGGLSGGFIKTGYAAVKKVRPGIIRGAVNSMLDDFVAALEPYWAGYQAQPTPGFGAYLAARPQEVSQALLAVTDRRAERSSRGSVTSVYNRLRPKGQDNVIEALPRLGDLVERHAH